MYTINRNNYEEFFLMYVDDELSPSTKLEVENFVRENADLAIELEMLMQTKLQPEELVLDKENLLRTEGNSINETNYEEYFLLYIDNELSAAKRTEAEKYILQHPRLQDEFTLLKQTIVPVENIVYNNKEDLYKYERKRVVYLKPFQLVAAAVLIGLLGVGYWMYERSNTAIVTADVKTQASKMQGSKVPEQQANKNQVKENIIVVKPVDSSLNVAQQQHQTQNLVQQKDEVAENRNATTATSVKKKKDIEVKKNEVIVAARSSSNKKEKTISNLPSNKQANPVEENSIVQQSKGVSNNNQVADNNNKNQLPITAIPSLHNKENNEPALPQVANANEANNSDYRTYNVSYKEIDPNSEDNSVHVGALDLNKTKVKSLLKKAGRLFGNKAAKNANDDGKLQVANFEIQTNNL